MGKNISITTMLTGDVIAITNSAGKIVAEYEYDTWGIPTKVKEDEEVKGNSYRYAGYRFDEETGLYYLIARYYEPRNGVFLSLDPDPGSDGDSLDQNGYTYGNNNPVMNVDPDGHWVWFVVNAGFAVYDGYKAHKSGKGWKGVAVAAASGFLGGGKLKGAKKVFSTGKKSYKLSRKKVKAKRTYSSYRDVTKKGSRTKNYSTNVSKRDFEKNLRRQGWKKSVHNGNVITMTKDGRKYSLRSHAKSTPFPTAEYTPRGKKKFTHKIRLKH